MLVATDDIVVLTANEAAMIILDRGTQKATIANGDGHRCELSASGEAVISDGDGTVIRLHGNMTIYCESITV